MKTTRKIKVLALVLAVVMLTLSLPLHIFAVELAASSVGSVTGTVTDSGASIGGTVTELKDYSMPSNDKHAYDPFAKLESEEATEAYRESAQYVAGSIIFKVNETKGWLGGYRDAYEEDALAAVGIDLATADEITRKKSDDGFFRDTYEVVYEAKLSGDVWEAVDALSTLEGVVDAQPNFIYEDTAMDVPTEISKNPHKGHQWHHDWLKSDDRWKDLYDEDITAGEGTIVAVIDTGVDYTHIDLAANMWVNTAELNGVTGADDDGNGYVDDIYGVSTVGAKSFHSGDPMDDHGHGTHVAGIIAMTANNDEGGVGLAYGTKIMAIKAGQATGLFSDTDIAEAINYAVAMGADVINMSFGGTSRSFLVEEALSNAFATTVLVAAAGNDGFPTSDAPEEYLKKWDVYPAGYTYVLGVMASDQDGELASFSNWDYYNNGGSAEYEIIAPGVDIWSTLPGNQYAAWDGTSMACPMVAAAAALVRSKYSDREKYSSRFIMGQLASATEDSVVYVDKIGKVHTYAALNLEDSLNKLPKPNLTVKNTYLFDDPSIDPANDGDGVMDAGETIDLGIVLRNQWGMAKEVTVTVDAISDGGVANPNIEWITDTITMENIGTFNEQSNSFVYEDGLLVGTDNPIRFKVKDDTINDAHIGFNIVVTAKNAMDEEDTELYVFNPDGYEMTFYVQRGRSLSGTISEDMTLTSDDYWIIDGQLYVSKGVTVTVEPGTQIQFWPSDYNETSVVDITVDGSFLVNGTQTDPVEMFPSAAFHNYIVYLYANLSENFLLEYTNIINPYLLASSGDGNHLFLTQNSESLYRRKVSGSSVTLDDKYSPSISINLSNSICSKLCGNNGYIQYSTQFSGNCENVLFDNCKHFYLGGTYAATTFVNCDRSLSVNPYIQDIGESTFGEIWTYGDSKYVLLSIENHITRFSNDTFYKLAFDFYQLFAESRGGTLAVMNSSEEANNTLSKISAGTTCLVGYHVNKNNDSYTGGWVDNSVDYVITPIFSNGNQYGYVTAGNNFSCITQFDNVKNILLEFPSSVSDDQITNEIAIKELLRVAASLPAYREFYNNAVLNRYDNSENLFEIAAGSGRDRYYIINNNYWGTTNDKLIDQIVTDNNDYTSLGHIVTDPILTLDSPELETIYPFVTEIYLTDTEGNRVTSVGYGQDVTVHVKFNRDMDTTVQPMVSYGPAEPYTDYVLDGEFVSPREWVADFAVKGVIDAGSEYFRVKDAVAADDAWLKTGTDAARFAFEVSRTGAEAMVLQATGGENKIELFWMQDDYDTLAGFNVYRSTSADGSFVKINTRLIPGTIREYVDTDVEPGKEYFYYFTVMGTDLVESIPSNIASAMPIDNVKPTVTHTRVTYGNAGEALSFTVTASDNIGVTYVKIFYRVQGSDTYSALTLSNTEGNKYYGVITASQVTAEGLEYYLEVSDGTSVVRDGSASTPIKVYIDNSLAIYSVTPFKVYTDEVAKGITATLTGVNFTDTMTLTVGGKAVDYTYLSSTQISFTLPTGNHGRCDVVLTDGARSADLNNAITYADRNSEAQITSPGEAKAREAIKLPIKLTAEGDIISAMLQLKLDKSLYSSIKFEKAATLGSAYATFNTTSAGVVKIAISSTTPIDLSEPVGYLVLTPNNTVEPIATSIEMTSATVNAIPVETLVDCALDIKPNFTFSGKITYYQGGAPIAGVRVTLNNGMTAYTDENGVYTFTGITTNHIVITVSHSGYVNNAITAMDASAILGDVVAESSSFTELQMIAADVDGDGMVTPHDAAYILQKNVGIIEGSFPGSGEEWTFVGSTVLYLTADRSDVNFTGILLGDVTGDWTDTPVEEMD